MKTISKFLSTISRFMGGFIINFYNAAKDSVELVIKTVIPFMIFVSALIGIILGTQVGSWIANLLTPLANNIIGLLLISLICGIPILSPLLGPGAVIASVVGTLIGTQIGMGNIPPNLSIAALFAINVQVGCDFFPVDLSLTEASPKTVEYGIPSILTSRWITGPIAVVIGWIFGLGMYK